MATDAAGWDHIRIAYEDTDETLDAIALRMGVSRSSITTRVAKLGWRRRRNGVAVDAGELVHRMYRLIERWLLQLERSERAMDEKDAGILTRVAATLDRLLEVEARHPAQKRRRGPPPRETTEMQQVRKVIARRLEQLGDI